MSPRRSRPMNRNTVDRALVLASVAICGLGYLSVTFPAVGEWMITLLALAALLAALLLLAYLLFGD